MALKEVVDDYGIDQYEDDFDEIEEDHNWENETGMFSWDTVLHEIYIIPDSDYINGFDCT